MPDLKKNINVLCSAKFAGIAAGKNIEKRIEKLQKTKNTIRVIFAAAPSQSFMLDYLVHSQIIEWDKIVAFNMDEYIGLPENSAQLFSHYLEENLFSKITLKKKFTINPHGNIEAELEHYTQLIQEAPIDIVCLGIGENGHIAFNDPPVANFNDPKIIKIVNLDRHCRLQQVHDGCFPSLEEVPEKAITLTIPTLLSAKYLFCVVLGATKSNAVKNTFSGIITTDCPASILTTHESCDFYFDKEAFKKVSIN